MGNDPPSALGRHRRDRNRARRQGDRLVPGGHPQVIVTDAKLADAIKSVDFAEVCIVSDIEINETGDVPADAFTSPEARGVLWWLSAPTRGGPNACARGVISIPQPPIPSTPG